MTVYESQNVRPNRFAANWGIGAGGAGWTQRRRLMAVLRRAHRVLGVDRKDMGVGSLGFGGGARSVLLASASPAGMVGGLVAIAALGLPSTAQAQTAVGNGTASGAQSIAIGTTATTATASGPRSIAIGNQPTAAGVDSIAQGTLASAGAQNAVAIGFQAAATQINTVYLGSRTVAGTGALAPGAIAIGTDVRASLNDAVAIGRESVASGQYTVALGLFANASGPGGAVAVGQGAISNNVNTVALGVQANATAAGASALGTFSSASGGNSTAVGVGATASNSYAWAGGHQSVASGVSSTAVGRMAGATGDVSTAVGFGAQASGNSALAFGSQATAIGVSTVAIGQGAGAASTTGNANSVAMGVAAGQFVSGAQNTAVGGGINSAMRGAGSGVTGARNVAFGTGDGGVTYDGTLSASAGSLVTGDDNVAIGTNAGIGVAGNATTSIGYNARASANNAIAMGNTAVADSADAVAIGSNSTATGGRAVAIGAGNTASGNGAVAIGDPNTATGNGAIASGLDNTATGNGSVAMGNTNMVGGGGQAVSTPGTAAQGAVGIGYQNRVVGQGAVALGSTSSALAAGALAFGDTAVANTDQSIAIGSGSTATGGSAIAIGRISVANGTNAAALGAGATANANSALALGNSAIANNFGDVALGQGSVTAATVATTGATINGTNYAFAGTTPTRTVSVGIVGAERTITNVAAGRISNSSTDAINGSQLFATNQAVDSLGTQVNQNTTDIANLDNRVTTIEGDLTNINNGAGIKYFRANSADPDSQALGSNSVAIGPNAVANNAGDIALGNGSVTDVAVATAGTTINGTNYAFAGTTPASTVSVGAVGAERTITNVAAGRLSNSSTDAVNGSQLFATNQAVSSLGTQVNQNTTDITNLSNTVAGGFTLTAQGANGSSIAPGDTVDLANTDGNITVGKSAASDNVSFDLADNITVDSVTAGGTLLNATGLTIAGGPSVTTAGINAGGLAITNVAAGVNPTDAVNVSQLTTVTGGVTTAGMNFTGNDASAGIVHRDLGQTLTIQGAATTAGTYSGGNLRTVTDPATGAINLQMADAPTFGTVTVNDGGSGRITGVTAGVAGTDAVNVSQLQAVSSTANLGWNIQANGDAATNVAPGGTVQFVNGQNIEITRTGSNVTIATSMDLIADSVTLSGGQVFNGAGLNMAGTTITNLADGAVSAVSSEAVNGSQLFATNQQVAQNTTDITNLDGRVTTVEGTVTNLGNTINNINNGGGIKYFHANSVLADSQALGTDSVAIGPNAVANNAGDVAIGNGSTTDIAVATGGATINGTNYAFAGTTPTSTLSVGAVGAERTITNVAAGRVSGSSTDAVNGSQLFATNQAVDSLGTQVTNLGNTVTNLGNSFTSLDGRVTNVEGSLTNLGNTITNIAGDTSTIFTDANGDGIRYARTNELGLAPTDAFAQGVGSTALGYQAAASAGNAVALGRGAQATVDGSLALGAGSVADRALAPAIGQIPASTGFVPYNTTDQTLLGSVSVGSAGAYRQITNVADGTQAQDAVTIRQLAGALSSFAVTPIVYFHANSTAADSLAVGQESVAIGPRTVVNGDNGIGLGNGAIVQATAPGGTAIGQNAQVSQADAIAFGTNAQANGIQSIAIGPGANATHSGSVALGAGSTTSVGSQAGYAAYGLTTPQNSAGEVSVGSAGAERKVTNVAAGSALTDAVNVSQLQAVDNKVANLDNRVTNIDNRVGAVESNVTNLGNSVANSFGGGSTYDPTTGTVTTQLNIGGNTYNNVNDALQAVNATAGAGWNIQANGGPSTNIGSNGTLNVTAGSNTVVTLSGNQLQVGVVDNPTFAGVVTANGGLAVGANTSVNMGGNVVQNVGAGAVNATSTDAVNGSQLHQVQQVANNSVQYDTDGNSVTLNPGGSAMAIHNVAAGVAPTDAVNVQQLNDGLSRTLQSANQYTDQKIAGIQYDLSQVRREASAGTAGALAAAGMPQAFEPGRGMLAFGAGTYRGQSAFALGLSRVMDDGKTVVKAGATYDTQQHVGANVGIGFQF